MRRGSEVGLALMRHRLRSLVAGALAFFVLGALAVLAVESTGDGRIRHLGDALWYTVVTMTTTGYGDLTPGTGAGRVVAVLLIVGGMGLAGAFTATIASILVAQRIREGRGLDTVRSRGHLIVCGWNAHAEQVLASLAAAGRSADLVLVNDLPEDQVSDLLASYRGLRFVRGDPASEATLERANVREASGAMILADPTGPSDERATLVALALKSLRPQLRLTVEALDLRGEPHLRRAGADEVVASGEFNAFLLSAAMLDPGVPAVIRPLLSHSGSELRRLAIPPEFVGRMFGELSRELRDRDGTLLVALVTEHPGLRLDDLLTDDTSLVDRFIAHQFQEAGSDYLRYEQGRVDALVNPRDDHVIGAHDAAVGIPARH